MMKYVLSITFLTVFLLFLPYIIWKIYETLYYKSEKFIVIKNKIEHYVTDCNELNDHIEDLKNTYLGINQLDYGESSYYDNSKYNYKRPELRKQQYAENIYNCSRSVCDNARKQPFKYICKYFNIKSTEDELAKFEKVLNNFEAAELGKTLLIKEKESILSSINNEIPSLIKKFGKERLEKELGFENINFHPIYYPRYIFSYISSGGNSSMRCDVVMDIENLNRFIEYLSENIKFKKSVAGQRALLTSALRKEIFQRDGYACKLCGASIEKEPNLLLEIDHIIPLAKGGLTTRNNLQVLCWRCNRKKGTKIL